MRLVDMTWEDVAQYLDSRTRPLVIIPCGSVEQHSLSMPLGTDTCIAEAISSAVADQVDAVMMPPISPGLSEVPHLHFAGTVSLRAGTVMGVVTDYVHSAYHHGFRDFLFINAHGLNTYPVNAVLQDLARDLTDIHYIYQDWWTISTVAGLLNEHVTPGAHSTAGELALMLHLYPHLVRPKFQKHEIPVRYFVSLNLVDQITDTGMLGGNQFEATSELGSALFKAIVQGYVSLVHQFQQR